MAAVNLNTSFLNRTVNKEPRARGWPYVGVICHETQSRSNDPTSSLNWNLKAYHIINRKRYDVYSSYNYLIARDGTIFHYVDETKYIAWHAGDSQWTLNGRTYTDYAMNRDWIGVEIDGPSNGTPATNVQIDAFAHLIIHLHETQRIPVSTDYYVTHAAIAAHRIINPRTDPRGYTVQQVIARAQALLPQGPIDYAALWGPHAPYNPEFGIPRAWRAEHDAGRPLGQAISQEFTRRDGRTWQTFERGEIGWRAGAPPLVRRNR